MQIISFSLQGLITLFILYYLYTEILSTDKYHSIRGSLLLTFSAIAFPVWLYYLVFYSLAGFIHSFNLKIPLAELTPVIQKSAHEHDGVESYVLFISVNLFLLVGLIIYRINFQQKIAGLKKPFIITAMVGSVIFLNMVRILPPEADFEEIDFIQISIQLVVVFSIIGLLKWVYKKDFRLFVIAFSLLMIPVCFIQYEPISIFDYQFILTPSLKLMEGIPLREIYMQYDLLLSLITCAWMKLQPDLTHLHLIGQLSYYLLFIVLLIFSNRFFANKELSIYFIFTVVLFRVYTLMHAPATILQVTPIRLDLWLPLLLIVYWVGWRHWLLGFSLGLMIFLHRNFGLLYFAAYLMLLFVMYVEATIEIIKSDEEHIIHAAIKHTLSFIQSIGVNLILIGLWVAAVYFFYGSIITESASLYQKIGIGMMPIGKNSFFWYVLVLLLFTLYLLLKNKSRLSNEYFTTGVFLLLLVVANSMYFFGRSHDHNLLNISPILILTFYLCIDLLQPEANINAQSRIEKLKSYLIRNSPVILLVFCVVCYSGRIGPKWYHQYLTIKTGKPYVPFEKPLRSDLNVIKSVTKGSSKVYFLSKGDDFLYYYYGHYKPEGYFNPYASWVIQKDMIAYFNTLIANQYYFVIPKNDPVNMEEVSSFLSKMNYNKRYENDKFIILWNENVTIDKL